MNVAQALAAAGALGVARLDAQVLLLHLLGRACEDRAWLLAHDTDPVVSVDEYLSLAKRRAGGEPLAYLVGEKEFFGLTLKVDARVLVPRPETETLVEWGLELLGCAAAYRHPAGDLRASHQVAGGEDHPVILDLGTGSGAIALAIKKHCRGARVEATDASKPALEVARANATALGLDITFTQGSWLDGIRLPCDLILSNPPYIRDDDEHLAALHHEPLNALASGDDGLADLRLIVAQAPHHLAPGGWLLLEHGYDQAPAVRELLEHAGFTQVQSRRDLAGIERCTGGQWRERG